MTRKVRVVAHESGRHSEYAAMVGGRAFPTRESATGYLSDSGFRETMATPHPCELGPGQGSGDVEVPRMSITDREAAERFAGTVPEDRTGGRWWSDGKAVVRSGDGDA